MFSTKLKGTLITFLIFFLLISCDDDNQSHSANAENSQALLDEVLNTMEKHSIYRLDIDWNEFKSEVQNETGSSPTINDVHRGIKKALSLLDDNHSFFIKPNGQSINAFTTVCTADEFEKPTLPDHIGYVKVNAFSEPSESQEATAYAEEIREQIEHVDHESIAGWIVDLRGNEGGNMWPMLAGIGTILGEGTVGYFVFPDHQVSSWAYEDHAATVNGNDAFRLIDPYEIINPNPKVAVLIDQVTASSGEALAIVFVGRSNTRSFGSPTCGRSTANRNFTLRDGSTLVLTTAYMADRNLKSYGVPIEPDVEASTSDILDLAIEWIED